MAQREKLTVEKRTVFAKQLKKLRREGVLPGNIYGKDFDSTAVQLSLKEFLPIFKHVGETGLVDLKLGEKTYPVLIHNVSVSPITHDPLHADFFMVNLKEKISAPIPLTVMGEPEAVSTNKGLMLQLLNELEVEALPTDLPERFEVDVTGLAEVGDQLTVADVKLPNGVTITNEATQVIFRIDELVSEAALEQEALEEAEATAAAETTEGEATPAEPSENETTPSNEEKTPQE